MKQIVVNIPDNKYSFFVKLLKSLDFVNKIKEDDIVIPDPEKKLMRKRIRDAKPHNFKNWEDIKDSFDVD